jgi:hypothetical protein
VPEQAHHPGHPPPGHLPKAHVAHASRGRVRLRLQGARGRPQRLEQVRRKLTELDGVDHVHINPDTGSVLVQGSVGIEALGRFAMQSGLFALEGEMPELKPVLDEVMTHAATADAELKRLTGGRIDLASAVVLSLAGLALVQLIRGEIAAPALTVLWYAASLALMARVGRREPTP